MVFAFLLKSIRNTYFSSLIAPMKNSIFILFICFCTSFMNAQQEDAWVYFVDKPSSATFLANPLTMLTQRSLDRRTRQAIVLDLKDVPLEASYVSSIANATGITVKARSKWLNAVHVRGTQANINLLLNLASVSSIDFGDNSLNKAEKKKNKKRQKFEKIRKISTLNYGQTASQVEMLNGDFLHDLGYTGNTMHIAVIDAGFKGVDTFSAFSRLQDANMANGEILGGYDFVNRNTNFYANTGSTHGLSVLSTIGGYIDSQFIGTAPDAQFYLFITEDAANESPLEESLWVEAAERADSLGVDVVNTSLGYTTFDDSSYDYSYSDMNGTTAFISRGAEIAFSRGMLLVTSAGNEGNDAWKYISAPADAPSVLTVGAVDAAEVIANFSSFGPSSDNRTKPEILAQGKNVYVINSSGNIGLSNGTSFSSPVMAGMVACLWQAFPMKKATEIRQIIIESADLYSNPTAQRGYGIPDYEVIYNTLSVSENTYNSVGILPNPVQSKFKVQFKGNVVKYQLKIIDVSGKVLMERSVSSSAPYVDISNLNSGMYFAEITFNLKKRTLRLIKK